MNRAVGWWPISEISLENPMVLKMKKTPRRKTRRARKGMVFQTDLFLFMEHAAVGRILP